MRGGPTRHVENRIIAKLRDVNVVATDQLVASLAETIRRCPPEIVGHTDSLLLGLLHSGSYTIDLLEAASAKPHTLIGLAKASVGSSWCIETEDAIDTLFESSTVLSLTAETNGTIETSDLLPYLVTPFERDFHLDIRSFPKECEIDPNNVIEPLGAAMRELIVYITSTLNLDFDAIKIRRFLAQRRVALTPEEDHCLDKRFGIDYPTMTIEELEFAIHAMNTWFLHRRVQTEPANICLRLVATLSPLLYGPSHFADAGGDLKILNTGLQLAKKFNPERDLNHLCLFNIGGRLQLGQYSYRNTVVTASRGLSNADLQPLNLEAIRPSPFLPLETVSEFERLLLEVDITEPKIQQFLEANPAFFEAMGYVRAIPHVCLREDGKRDMIPDFILELPGGRGFDVLDLKLPGVQLLSRQPYLRVSAEISKAIAQLKAYKDFFNKAENRKRFEKVYGLEAFRPEVCVVIGRKQRFESLDDRRTIEELMNGTRLLTYDDVIAYGRSRVI